MSSKPIQDSEILSSDVPGVSPPERRHLPGGRAGLALGILALGLEAPLAVAGLYGGSTLFRDPSGASMDMSLVWLAGTPFPDYELPGAVLLVANGIFPLCVCAAIIVRSPRSPELVITSGAVLIGWMTVQIAMIGYELWIQALFLGIGLALAAVGVLWTVVRRVDRLTEQEPS